MTPAERADKIISELREKFIIGGQRATYLRARIIEEIQEAEKAAKKSKSKY